MKSQQLSSGIEGGQVEAAPALRLDNTASPILYLGKADVGSATSAAVWAIQKIDTTSGADVTWANGKPTFVNIWDNRASLSYS